MINVTVLYPHKEGVSFDMGYYCNTHMPMVACKLGSAVKGVTVEQGLSGIAPGTAPTYRAIARLQFESIESFQAAFGPHAAAILADIPNYTSIEPNFQISEIKQVG